MESANASADDAFVLRIRRSCCQQCPLYVPMLSAIRDRSSTKPICELAQDVAHWIHLVCIWGLFYLVGTDSSSNEPHWRFGASRWGPS